MADVPVPEGFRRLDGGRDGGVVREEWAGVPLTRWWQEGDPLPGAPGRGAVRVVALPDGDRAVARGLRRGGALRRWLPDAFLDRGRAAHELTILAELRRLGVPAVEPIAAVWRRAGPLYRQRLLTRLVPGAAPLPAFLAAHPAQRRGAIREAGRVVRLVFGAGLRHRDLHPDNLLACLTASGVVVRALDLDRARLGGALSEAEQDRMLLRMARYLERHAARLATTPSASDFLRFLAGMGLERRARRQEWARLSALYERATRRHRWSWRWSTGTAPTGHASRGMSGSRSTPSASATRLM
ncbi:MAG: lipopolysaccharide kinase InaA family protein [Planctomycetota bacterium]